MREICALESLSAAFEDATVPKAVFGDVCVQRPANAPMKVSQNETEIMYTFVRTTQLRPMTGWS